MGHVQQRPTVAGTGSRAAPTFALRYRAEELIRFEQGVSTWRGRDVDTERDVIIKAAPASAAAAATRTWVEFSAQLLRELELPTVPAAEHTGEQDGYVYVVRPFIRGRTLREQIDSSTLEVRAALELAGGLLRALEVMHVHGIMHGDIKPSNVILGSDGNRAPRLVDFGLARYALAADAMETLPIEAVRYMPPEQSGILERGIDARSDLYAVGLLLYEALTQRAPFSAPTLGAVLRDHLTQSPPSLRAVVPSAPPALERIIARLVQKDPRDRYQTARGARADVEELAAVLSRGESDGAIIVGARDDRTALTEPAFTGRNEELAILEQAFADAQQGRGALVLVEGESGVGKTWLVEEFIRRAARDHVWVLRGQGAMRVVVRPFQVLSGLARQIASSAQADRVERVSRAIRPVRTTIGHVLPPMQALVGSSAEAQPSSLDPQTEERTLAALVALLDGLGASDDPALVVIDDGQWVDSITLRLLARWHASAGAGARHVLVVVAYRPEELDDGHPLASMQAHRRIPLGLFGEGAVREQIASMAGELPAKAVALIVEHAVGNPFLASAVLHGLVESGALTRTVDGWELDDKAVQDLQVSGQFVDLLSTRLARLSPAARELLAVGALLGRSFDVMTAAALAGSSPEEAVRLALQLRGSLLWMSRPGKCTFLHDRIREALGDELPPSEKRRLHLEAARLVSDEAEDADFALAYHYDEAGEPTRALPHALAAAEAAKARYDMELAERYYRVAARGLSDGDHGALQYVVARGLGDVLLVRSSYEEAARELERALALASDDWARADVEERRAQLAFKQGDLKEAARHGERALRLVGRYVPKGSVDCAAIVLWEMFVQVLHTYFPKRFVRRRQLSDGDRDLFAVRVHNGLNGPYFFARGGVWVLWTHLRALNISERYPSAAARGREYGVHGSACSGFPWLFDRAVRYTRAGADMCAEHGDLWGQARALQFHALTLCASGRYEEAVKAALEGGRLFDSAGDAWEAINARVWAPLALYRKGDLDAAAELAKTIYARSRELDSGQGIAFAVDPWARAVEGRVPEDILSRELTREGGHIQSTALIAQAEAIRLLRQDRPAEAERLLQSWLDRMREEGAFVHESNHSLVIYLLSAQRRLAEKVPPTNPRQRARLLRRARRTCKMALKRARQFRNSEPFALREVALVQAMSGRRRAARAAVDRSVAAAERLGARFELASSRELRGTLGVALGWEGAAEELTRARGELAALRAPLADPGERLTPSLVDRFREIVRAGHRIARSLTADEIFEALRESILALLRGQRASVLYIAAADDSGRAQPEVVHGDAEPASPSMIREAMETQAVVIRPSDAQPIAADETLARSATRSALCAPICVRGEVAAVAYTAHAAVSAAFGEEERRIAEFLTALAGAALENAEGFRKIQELSRELEERVRARTAELAERNEELADSLRRLENTQDQLLHAGRMAAVGTLIAGLSHELNNPLAVVIGNVENLLRVAPECDDRARAHLTAIERQAKRAAGLVTALLDFSRSGPASPEPVEPEVLVRTAVDLGRPEAKKRDIELRVEVAEKIPVIAVSKREIESALVNILTNALDATPQRGQVTLRVDLAERNGQGGLQFSVRDSGAGISQDLLAQIFDPFFTTKPVGQGTGLGLSLARQAVIAHGGELEVADTSSSGTTMSFWLPLEPTEPHKRSAERLGVR